MLNSFPQVSVLMCTDINNLSEFQLITFRYYWIYQFLPSNRCSNLFWCHERYCPRSNILLLPSFCIIVSYAAWWVTGTPGLHYLHLPGMCLPCLPAEPPPVSCPSIWVILPKDKTSPKNNGNGSVQWAFGCTVRIVLPCPLSQRAM